MDKHLYGRLSGVAGRRYRESESVANSAGGGGRLHRDQEQSGCMSERVPDGGCHDNLAHSRKLQFADRANCPAVMGIQY